MGQKQPLMDDSDRAAGIVILILAGLYFFWEVGLLILAGSFLSWWGVSTGNLTPDEAATLRFLIGLAAFWSLGVGVANTIVGVGVLRSARWAFMLGAALNTINVVAELVRFPAIDEFKITVSAMITVYCVMRLMGKIGRPPT